MQYLSASPLEATPVAAACHTAIARDRDVVLPLLPGMGGLLPLVLPGLAL
jgi:hypothetical protein